MAYTTINKPSEYFNTVLYQSNNGTPLSVTGVGFQPDFLWVKDREGGGTHVLVDVIRGSTKWLASDQTSGEVTRADQVISFDSDGFSLGADSGNFINYSTNNNVAWNWLANGAGSSNTDGDITSTVSANTTSGFSIVSYTGTGANATVGHGLGVAPKMIIVKPYSVSQYWTVFHSSVGNTYYGYLNTTDAFSNSPSNVWNSTINNTVFGIGSGVATNLSSETHIAYCFAEKKGFSKFGSYTGNGNADGTFVYTGFKPAFVICKMSSASGQNWELNDNKRNPYNEAKNTLRPNTADAEDGTFNTCDLLSNGFKLRTSNDATNQSSATYIYMAFAENPLVGTNNIPATAR
jgi:hypothetical protein